MRVTVSDLERLLEELNRRHFDGRLRRPRIALSGRLRVTAGLADYRAWTIRISASYHERFGWDEELRHTLVHEMIHLWLRQNGRPSGHTAEFHTISRRLGCPRWAKREEVVPRLRYRCPACGMEVRYRRRVRLACRACCDRLNGGRFTSRFLLRPAGG